MKTIKLTVAQATVKFLMNQYIEVDGKREKFVGGVMGIFGHGNVVGMGQALEEYKNEITYIPGKNEQDIAHACTGYAKQSRRRKIFACTASIGPGSLNMVTAAGTATVNRIPVLLLPSDTYADRQPDPVLQQMENEMDYTVTVNDAFKAVSKYFDRVYRPEQLMSALLNAFRVLSDPAQTGACTICLPQDVQGESYDYPESFFEERVWYLDRAVPTPASVERAVEAIMAAKKPVIISGGGVRFSDAGQEILAFAKQFNIPVTETQAGKGEVSYKDDLYMGCAGVCGTLSANLVVKNADLVIAVGTKLNDFVTCSKAAFANNPKMVAINVNRFDSLKMDAVSVVADAKAGIIEICKALMEKGYKSSYTSEYADAKKAWTEEMDKLSKIEIPEGLSQTRVLIELNKMMNEDDVIVVASGSLPSDVERLWDVHAPGGYHIEYGFSCMGYEVGAAMGAKVAAPEKNIYAFIGDGVFHMSHSEFVTSIQEGRKITVVVFDNCEHGCIHNLQMSQGMGTFGTVFKYRDETNQLVGDSVKVDFAKIAEGYGGKSYRVTKLEDLKPAFEAAKKETVSTLIDIKILPHTMTEGYENFWRVGTATTAKKPEIQEAGKNMTETVSKLRKY